MLYNLDLSKRPRRNRKMAAIRELCQETFLHPRHFIAPIFIIEGTQTKEPIPSMPGVYRFTIDLAIQEIKELQSLGVTSVNLFAKIQNSKKTFDGKEALHKESLLFLATAKIKQACPEICVMVDIALDPFTTHGHDGLINTNNEIDNDLTLEALGRMSYFAASSGADVLSPSDMMDGRVGYIRKVLDAQGFTQTAILSYTAKYASALYGPFRDALESHLSFGDKKTYQISPTNQREAIREAVLDESEGADFLMVKPATFYLDVITEIKKQTHLPVGAYHVSGEYSMIMAAAEKGWVDGTQVLFESLICIKRAGADFILTYGAKQILTSGLLT